MPEIALLETASHGLSCRKPEKYSDFDRRAFLANRWRVAYLASQLVAFEFAQILGTPICCLAT
jgi:hypothetical protein